MMKIILFQLLIILTVKFGYSQTIDTIYLWPGNVPGETEPKHEATATLDKSGDVNRLTDVTNPLLVVYIPEKSTTNASVVICPGGGYNILAINKEGYEIATWLKNLGITAYVLQYRVPGKQEGALQDAQRAIRLVRQINNEQSIGIMGFSAGGSLSARASTQSNIKTYEPVDEADQLSAQPDFAALIYPAYLDLGENRSLTPELTITDQTPPLFIFATADDKYGNSALVMTTAMRDNNRPVELHFLAEGGHGYGLRKGNKAGETWPGLLKIWLDRTINLTPLD